MTSQLDASEATWINVLPARWPRARNKELLAESIALSQAGAEELLSVSHLTGITPKSEKRVTMIEAESLDGYRLVEPGDLVINMMWAWMGALGVSRYAGIVSPAYSVYRRKPGVEVDSRYFDYLYRSDLYVVEMTRYSRGIHSSRLRLYPNVFLSLLVPNPPLDEQRAIADYLDRETARIDALIEEQQRLIELLQERRQSAVDHILLDPRFESAHLRRLVDVIDCAHVTAEFVEDDRRYPVASIRECSGSAVDLSNCQYTTREFFDHLRSSGRAPRVGDLLFIRNVSVGLVAAVEPGTPDFAVGQETVLLRRKTNVDPHFLRYALTSSQVRHAIDSAMIGSTFRRINVAAIRSLPVVAPTIDEQRRIAAYLDEQTAKIDTLIAETETFIELARERRSALITAAVTGQIDVREVA